MILCFLVEIKVLLNLGLLLIFLSKFYFLDVLSKLAMGQWHRTGYSWSPVRTLPMAPLWCDLGCCQMVP